MGVTRFSIKYKLGLVLLIAVGLPLLIGIVSIQILGRKHYRALEGELFESVSHDLSLGLGIEIAHQVELIGNWIQTADIAGQIDHGRKPQSLQSLQEEVDAVEKEWGQWDAGGPELARWLDNSLAEKTHQLMRHNPIMAEILVTDRYGRLVAASEKTSDYFQADEKWWQCAFDNPRHMGCLNGVNFDQSAKVYSIDIAMPIHNHDDLPIGVVKCIININPLLVQRGDGLVAGNQVREVVVDDGRIMLRFFDKALEPFQTSLNQNTMQKINSARHGWIVMPAIGTEPDVIGFSEVTIGSSANFPIYTAGLHSLFTVVRRPLASVMSPVNAQLWAISVFGFILAAFCLAGGFYFSDRQLLRPIRGLGRAARAIAARAHLEGGEGQARMVSETDLKDSMLCLNSYLKKKAGDEIRLLTADFLLMAKRVLSYHRQLEQELESKTEEISQDLMLAREFQEALLPQSYPQVPISLDEDSIKLNFYHIYKPASLVSGDLVHMIQLSDHKAAIFIADVMGHGTRSALISAILRTLVQNASSNSRDPATLMETVNRQFIEIVPKGADLVFATAVYAIFDTHELTAKFAIAGHPSPLVIKKKSGLMRPVINVENNDPAIGLVTNARYRNIIHSCSEGSTFLYFTDGVVEAENEKREEFGNERLYSSINACPDSSGQAIANAVMEDLDQFMGTAITRDDICLVTVSAVANR